MSFANFSSGKSHSFGGEYVALVPSERIVYTDRFDDPNMPGEMRTTVTLQPVSCGTDLTIVQEGLPEAIPRRCATSDGRSLSTSSPNS